MSTLQNLTKAQLVKEAEALKAKVEELELALAEHTAQKTQLRESEERYRTILDSIEDGYFEVDLGGSLTFFNDSFPEILGYSIDELPGLNYRAFMSPEDAEEVFQNFNRVYRTGESAKTFAFEYIRKDGVKRYIETSVTLVRDANGESSGFRGIVRDITERKRAEQREVEQRTLAEALRDTAEAVNSTLNYEDVLERILANVGRVVPHDAANIMLIEADNVQIVGKRGYAEDALKSSALPTGKPYSETPSLKQMFETGQPLTIPDTHAHPDWTIDSEIQWIRSYAGAPIKREGEVIGFINLDSATRNFFTTEYAEHLQAFADQVAVAIGNSRLHQAIQERATRLELIERVGQKATAILDPDELLHQAVTLVEEAFGYFSVSIMLIEDDMVTLKASTFSSLQPQVNVDQVPLGKGMIGWVALNGEPLLAPDVSQQPHYFFIDDTKETKSELTVPIILKDVVIGVVDVQSTELNALSQIDVFTLQTIAGQLATAIENANLYDRIRRRQRYLETLRRVSRRSVPERDPQAFMQAVVDGLVEEFGYPVAALSLADDKTRELRISALGVREGMSFDLEVGHRQSYDSGILGRVISTGKPYLAKDISKDAYYQSPSVGNTMRSGLAVPLTQYGKTIGTLSIQSTEVNQLDELDQEAMVELAEELVVNLENVRLNEKAEQQASQMEALRQITLDITAQLNVDSLLKTLVESAVELLGARAGGIFLYRPERDDLEWSMAVRDSFPIGSTLKRGEGLSGKVWESGKPLIVDNYGEWQGRALAYDTKAHPTIIGVPIRWAGKFLGVLNANADSRYRKFTDEDTQFLSMVADQAAIAIYNAQLIESIRRRQRYLETLRRVSRRSVRLRDRDEFMQAVVEALVDEFAYSGAVILLGDDESRELTMRAADPPVSPPIDSLSGYRQSYDEGIFGWVMRHGEPYMTNNLEEDPHAIAPPESFRVASTIAVPLRQYGEIIGILAVSSPEAYALDELDREAIVELADELTVSMENVDLYRTSLEHAEQLEARVAERTAELETINKHLQALSQLKDEFVANVSHELRTPIANLLLYIDLLGQKPEKSAAYLDTLQRETERLRHIVEDMLQLSLMDQGQTIVAMTPVDLNEIVSIFVSDRPLLAESREISLTLNVQPDLAPILADRDMLDQALSILLTNALNYTPPGGRVVLSTHSRQIDDELWIGFDVTDSGPGISPDERERLFERFFRGKAAHKAGIPGTGLGLAILKEIVERHAGRTEVEHATASGKGSKFSVWLPAYNASKNPTSS